MRGLTPAFQFCARKRLEIDDLLLEAVGGIAGERQLVPDQARRGIERFDREPRRVRIGEIGQHQNRRRMLEEAVRHFLQRQPHIFEADLLADHVERHVGETVVHGAHHPRQHRAVADAGVEHAHRRRPRMDVGELFGDAVRHLPLFAAGVDEQQILLPVVEEAEIALRVAQLRPARRGREQRKRAAGVSRVRSMTMGRGPCGRMGSHEAVDAVERVGRDPTAVAQPRGELAVIDGAASERRFGKSGLAAIVGDFLKQLLGVHGTPLPIGFLDQGARPFWDCFARVPQGRANQLGRRGSTTKLPTIRVGKMMGYISRWARQRLRGRFPPRRPRTFGARLPQLEEEVGAPSEGLAAGPANRRNSCVSARVRRATLLWGPPLVYRVKCQLDHDLAKQASTPKQIRGQLFRIMLWGCRCGVEKPSLRRRRARRNRPRR